MCVRERDLSVTEVSTKCCCLRDSADSRNTEMFLLQIGKKPSNFQEFFPLLNVKATPQTQIGRVRSEVQDLTFLLISSVNVNKSSF